MNYNFVKLDKTTNKVYIFLLFIVLFTTQNFNNISLS
jgi:hypothetical protein